MKTVTYRVRLPKELYAKVRAEAKKRQKRLSEIVRDLITYGFEALPPWPDERTATIADTWETLGSSPEIDYDKLPTR